VKTSAVCVLALSFWPCSFAQSPGQLIQAPRFWNDHDLADWATPVAGLNVRPGHFSEKEYYAAPIGDYFRSYPVYFPGREPPGFWQMLEDAKPEPLIPSGARTKAQWIAEGGRVFRELDQPSTRRYDPKFLEILRSSEALAKLGVKEPKNGILETLRLVPTAKGLEVSLSDCGRCHSRTLADGSILPGASIGVLADTYTDPAFFSLFFSIAPELSLPPRALAANNDEPRGMALWRQFAVPWVEHDIHDMLKSMTPDDQRALNSNAGVVARFNGSPFFPTKIPDLIGIQDRKYLDHTATHRLRDVPDLMRYAALISCCDLADFGSYHMLAEEQRRIRSRFSNDLLFALAQYLYTLEPSPNPNAGDARASAGQKIFEREGCPQCHTPPFYSSNKLTLAAGFKLPPDHPLRDDIIPISVGTDPSLALKTRKGTGLYKIPSLKGVWYRALLGHDGSVSTLEEWFDPARLNDDYIPSGFKGYKATHRAVPGHEFGLKLNAEDKVLLIAFLRTL
jgi:hypothetical protein